MLQAYVYIITNDITGQFYYGSRAGNIRKKLKPEEDLWIHYFTSSMRVKVLIEELGVESFTCQILFTDSDYQVCYWKEQQLIKDNRKNPLNLNGTYIDPDSGSRMLSSYGETDEAKRNRLAKMSKTKKGKFNSNGHYGLKHSELTKQRMRDAQALIKYKHPDDLKKQMATNLKEVAKNMTAEERQKRWGGCKGRHWKLIDGKRVWFNKEDEL